MCVLLAGCHPAAPIQTPSSRGAPARIVATDAATTTTDAPPPASSTEPPPSTATPPTAPPGHTPPPVDDAALASLPLDVTVSDEAALLATHRRDCKAFGPRTPCELQLDLDGDGAIDRAYKIRSRASKAAGIAIVWADGHVSIVGADARARHLETDVYEDGVDLGWREAPPDLSGDEMTWAIADRVGDGLVRRGGKGTPHRAPALSGGGIWLDGGDAAEILYWDGAHWRWLVLGF